MSSRRPFQTFSITSRGESFSFTHPVVMGILNVTPDSFYDGGRYMDDDSILRRAEAIVEEGADIIDIGVTSTRPGASTPNADDEACRLKTVVALVRAAHPDKIISADTFFATSARSAVKAGADIINDISGGCDPNMFDTVASLQVPYVLTHNEAYSGDGIKAMTEFFSSRLHQLYQLGAKDIWLDPGFGFSKTLEQNHDILHRIHDLTVLFREPILVGISRKSMIYKLINSTPDSDDTLTETLRLQDECIQKGASILRVHDVKACIQSLEILFSNQYNL